MSKFLNYSVSTEVRPDHVNYGDYCVTAEFTDHFEVLSWHETLPAARDALKCYVAADKRRAR